MTGFPPKVTHPFLLGSAFARLLGLAARESGSHTDAGARRAVVVRITGAVDVAGVRRVAGVDGTQPHVGPTSDA